MKDFDLSIKIKIDKTSLSREDLEDLRRWEDEGGLPDEEDIAVLPIRPGEVFEVVRGDVIYENGEIFYLVDLNILSLPE